MKLADIRARLFLLLVVCIACATAGIAVVPAPEPIEGTVEKMLRQRDLGELANELARTPSSGTTKDLLIRLSVFGRADQATRVHQALIQLINAKDFTTSPYNIYISKVAQRAIDKEDLEDRKLYYEKIAPAGDDEMLSFVSQWQKNGDATDLEAWLKARAGKYEGWWPYWLRLKQELGTADEIYDGLEQQIRNDPSDFYLVQKYLSAVANPWQCQMPPCGTSYRRPVSWLASVIPTDTAYGAYDLAIILRYHDPLLAANLLQKSLSLPFVQKDRDLFGQRAFRNVQIAPVVRDPEKQTRYWTKKALVQIYLGAHQENPGPAASRGADVDGYERFSSG